PPNDTFLLNVISVAALAPRRQYSLNGTTAPADLSPKMSRSFLYGLQYDTLTSSPPWLKMAMSCGLRLVPASTTHAATATRTTINAPTPIRTFFFMRPFDQVSVASAIAHCTWRNA